VNYNAVNYNAEHTENEYFLCIIMVWYF